ncbi:MAG: hypothetical protein KKA73_08725 [Chloroflexi bacterium]|nr:hypothetical protein [Chloroflexota bacterium]MBU1747761.1 hypothetical protein [Chloroflexota bacterium]
MHPSQRPFSRRHVLSVLLSMSLIGVALSASLCPDRFKMDTTETRLQGGETPPFEAHLLASTPNAAPGQQVQRMFGHKGTIQPGPVTYVWTPPLGAAGFVFDQPPINSTPPFKWIGTAGMEVNAQFRLPTLPPGESEITTLEAFQVRDQDGSESSAFFRTTIATHTLSGAAVALPLATSPANDVPVATGYAPLWNVDHMMFQGITLTQSLCQEWAAFVKSDDAFIALRVPVSPTAAITEGYLSPLVVYPGPNTNYLRLFNYLTSATIWAVPLALRPDRLTFLESALPSAPGEVWIALGGAPATTNCPADLNLDTWGIETRVELNLSFLPDYGAGRTLPLYYCYEGQEIPPVFAALPGTDMAADAVAYQGDGITCIGPQAVPLISATSSPLLWDLRGTAAAWVTPTQSLIFHHPIAPGDLAPFTVDVTYTSSLEVSWGLYGGDWIEPNLSDPLTPPLLVTGFTHLWLVSDPVPAGTAHGEYGLVITATNVLSAADLRWLGDTIWVGDWVAPPALPKYRLYLPLVLHQSM